MLSFAGNVVRPVDNIWVEIENRMTSIGYLIRCIKKEYVNIANNTKKALLCIMGMWAMLLKGYILSLRLPRTITTLVGMVVVVTQSGSWPQRFRHPHRFQAFCSHQFRGPFLGSSLQQRSLVSSRSSFGRPVALFVARSSPILSTCSSQGSLDALVSPTMDLDIKFSIFLLLKMMNLNFLES